jgi:propanediol utilization protein
MSMDDLMTRIANRVMERLALPLVTLEASGRHVHVTREDADVLFGVGAALTPVADLSQPGQFVCQERIRVVGRKGTFDSVVILGPERPETQVEISATDALALGVKPPVRLSGSLAGTPGIRLEGPAGAVDLDHGVIIAKRHIHMHPDYADRHGLVNGQEVSVRVWGERAMTFRNVELRVSPKFATFMHVDYDEANACGFAKGMVGDIIV